MRRGAPPGLRGPGSAASARHRGGDVYVRALLAPLSIDPSVQPEHFGALHRVVTSCVVAAMLLLAWRYRVALPWWILGPGWVIAVLLPMYLVPLRHDGACERHLYAALWGAGLALSCELASRLHPALAIAAGCAATFAFSVGTAMRNADYASEVMLWDAASRVPNAGPRAFNNLGEPEIWIQAGGWRTYCVMRSR